MLELPRLSSLKAPSIGDSPDCLRGLCVDIKIERQKGSSVQLCIVSMYIERGLHSPALSLSEDLGRKSWGKRARDFPKRPNVVALVPRKQSPRHITNTHSSQQPSPHPCQATKVCSYDMPPKPCHLFLAMHATMAAASSSVWCMCTPGLFSISQINMPHDTSTQ